MPTPDDLEKHARECDLKVAHLKEKILHIHEKKFSQEVCVLLLSFWMKALDHYTDEADHARALAAVLEAPVASL